MYCTGILNTFDIELQQLKFHSYLVGASFVLNTDSEMGMRSSSDDNPEE